jgi:serine/threonine-protein phosphatase 6 regulatory ankyrin repeat subunit B
MARSIFKSLLGGLTFLSLVIPAGVGAQRNLHADYQLLVESLRGNTDAVKNLLREGADPNTPPGPNDRGMSALMFAAWKGNSQIVKLLADSGAAINASSSYGATPLMYGAMSGDDQSIKLLLRKGANADAQEQSGNTALIYAVLKQHIEAVRTLVKEHPEAGYLQNHNGDTALLLASRSGNWQIVDALLLAKAPLEVRDQFGQTPLMNAARLGHLGIVLRLLDKGADVNAKDASGRTAVTLASLTNRQSVLRALRARGARP